MDVATYKTLALGSIGIAICAAIGTLIMIFGVSCSTSNKEQKSAEYSRISGRLEQSTSTDAVSGSNTFRALNGMAATESYAGDREVRAFMIDNHPDARPQGGVAEAPVVYEMPVEGAYTRFMALFSDSDVATQIGPIRSARPYFIDVAREYGIPTYVHSGGSPDALTLLKSGVVRDGNEFFMGGRFSRDASRKAPHTIFTSTTAWLSSATAGDGEVSSAWSGWKFERYIDDASYRALVPFTSTTNATSGVKAIVRFYGNSGATWTYDAERLRYGRSVRGEKSLDMHGVPIEATTIVIQRVAVKSVDAEDRKSLALIGSGKGWIVSRGRSIEAVWKKTSATERTRWYDVDGKEIVFIPGTMWIHLVPLTTAITVE